MILDDAREAMNDLVTLTGVMGDHGTPDVYSLLANQGRLVALYQKVGEERTKKFNAKESRYLGRKLEQARQYHANRYNVNDNTNKMMSTADATEAALLVVGDESQQEIDSATEWELYGTFLKSRERAIDHSRQVVSFLGKAEKNPCEAWCPAGFAKVLNPTLPSLA